MSGLSLKDKQMEDRADGEVEEELDLNLMYDRNERMSEYGPLDQYAASSADRDIKPRQSSGSGSLLSVQTAFTGRATASLAAALSTYTQHYEELALLGKGGFGEVVLVRHRLDGTQQAIKRLNFSSEVPPWAAETVEGRVLRSSHSGTAARLLREVESLSSLSHRRIVKYRSCWIEPRWPKLVEAGSGSPIVKKNSFSRSHKNISMMRLSSSAMFDEDVFEDSFDSLDDDISENSEAIIDGSIEGRGILQKALLYRAPSSPVERRSSSSSSLERLSSPSTRGQHNVSSVVNFSKSTQSRWPYTLYVAMDVCRGVTLEQFINPKSNNDVDEALGNAIILQLAEGLEYIHDSGLIHRDIKPANVFVDVPSTSKQVSVCICDFGLATWQLHEMHNLNECEENSESECAGSPDDLASTRIGSFGTTSSIYGMNKSSRSTGIGTLSYCAPEQISGEMYNEKVDVFSLGILIIELFTKFDTRMERVKVLADARRGIMPHALQKIYPFHADLAARLVNHNPSIRPSASEVIEIMKTHIGIGDGAMTIGSPMKKSISGLMSVIDEQSKKIKQLEAELKKMKTEPLLENSSEAHVIGNKDGWESELVES